jgi:hypothetical protein
LNNGLVVMMCAVETYGTQCGRPADERADLLAFHRCPWGDRGGALGFVAGQQRKGLQPFSAGTKVERDG